MPIAKPFKAHSGALAYIPKGFDDTLLSRMQAYGHARRSREAHMLTLEDLCDAALQDDNTPNLQGMLSDAYLSFIEDTQDIVGFLTFCLKNEAYLPVALRRIENDVRAILGRDYPIEGLADRKALKQELYAQRELIFEKAQMAITVMSRLSRSYLSLEGVAPIFLASGEQTEQGFHDWVEALFFEKNQLPLNLYARSKALEESLKEAVTSASYGDALMEKIRSHEMQESFPGLSLDGKAPRGSQLREVYQRIATYVSTFTPTKTACVIPLNVPGQNTEGTRRRARRPIRHRQTRRAPR